MRPRRGRRDRRRRRGRFSRRHLLAHDRALEHDADPRPFARRRVELDASVERADRLTDDGEAETEALRVAVASAIEAVEHVPLRLGAHADTGVLDLDADAAAVRVGAQDDASRWRVLRRVLAEVPQRLLEQVAVDAGGETRLALHLDDDFVVRAEV